MGTIDDDIYADYIAGFGLREISKRTSTDLATIKRVVSKTRDKAAKRLSALERKDLIALEAQRLDALQAKYWKTAMAGDIKDAEFVLKVMDRRAKMLELDKPVDQASVSRLVLISGATKSEFMDALREAQQGEKSAEFGRAPADILKGELEEEEEQL